MVSRGKKYWAPGSGRQPSLEEARAHAEWTEASPGTRYRPPTSGAARAAVTGRDPSLNQATQEGLFPDETRLPDMSLSLHENEPPQKRAKDEARAEKFAGAPVSRMKRRAQFEVDSALAEGRSPDFYSESARNQVGRMAQRTGVDFQTAAAATATTSPQKPWQLGPREVNIEVAEAQIERTIRDRGLARTEKHVPHPQWDALRDADRDYRYENVLDPALHESTEPIADKTEAVVEFGTAGADPAEARWGGMFGDGDQPVFGPGMKETSFYQNFRQPGNPQNRVTFDRHMSDALVGRELGNQFRTGPSRYRIGSGAFEQAADVAGVPREGAQAAAWTRIKAGKGHEGGSYDESGEGLSHAEREEIRRANPPMIRQRGDEFIPNVQR
jgi:hypothetical protein